MTDAAGPARAVVLVVDVGLTAVKAALVDRRGRFAALARRFWPGPERPFDLGRDLDAVWPAVVAAAREALAMAPPGAAVAAVAATAAAQLGLCLDRDGEAFVLPPLPGRPRAAGAGGRYPPGSGYGRTLVRTVRNARRADRARFGRIARVGALHTYVLWRLTGRWASDAATGPGALEWPPQLVHASGLPAPAFADLLAQEAAAGPLTAAAARALGLAVGLPVAVGGQDGACASFGAGAYHPGDCLLNLSTNFVPRIVTGSPVPGLFGYPIRPSAWAWVDGLPLCGRQIDLAARTLAGADAAAPSALADAAVHALRVDAPRPVLPYLEPAAIGGQGARLRAALAEGHRPERVYLAVVEGCVAALVRRVRVGEARNLRPARYVVTGGLSRQAVVTEALEGALGAPLEMADPEAGALGAAALAAPSAGWFPTPEAALEAWGQVAF